MHTKPPRETNMKQLQARAPMMSDVLPQNSQTDITGPNALPEIKNNL